MHSAITNVACTGTQIPTNRSDHVLWGKKRLDRTITPLQKPARATTETDTGPTRIATVLPVKAQLKTALNDNRLTNMLWGEGPLGRMFPEHFGYWETWGGVVGRPQHSGHEFTVDRHILLVMERVRQHRYFRELCGADQENLLLAAMMHDIAKRAGIVDPDHERRGAEVATQVLFELNFAPPRIALIAGLIARHNEVSFTPNNLASKRLSDHHFLDNIARHYGRITALVQLRILNESDIKSISSDSAYWTAEVEAELDLVQRMLRARLKFSA